MSGSIFPGESRGFLEIDKSSIAGAVSSTGGPRCEELRDVGQQVGLPWAEGELRGGVGVDVVITADCQAQSDVSRRRCCCLWTGVAVAVKALDAIALPCWKVAVTLPVLSLSKLHLELTLGLTVTDSSNVLAVSRHGVAVVRVLRVPTPRALARVWACVTIRSTLRPWLMWMVTVLMVTMLMVTMLMVVNILPPGAHQAQSVLEVFQ